MKKIIMSSFILILTVCMMGNVYGAFSCEMNMKTSKTQVSKNDEFTIDVNIANIQSERGVISFGGTLENGWETPSNGSAFNEENGKIGITRNGVGKNNETVFKMTFQVKEASKSNLVVSLKDMVISDGTVPFKISNASETITLVAGTSKPIPDAGTDNKNPNNSTNNINHNTGTSSNANLGKNTTTNTMGKNTNTVKNIDGSTTVKTGVLPKAGITNDVMIIGISLMALAAGIFFLKMKRNNSFFRKN